MTTELAKVNEYEAMALPDAQIFRQQIEAINRFQAIVHECMVSGQDFGVIPGTDKPTLLKPGAEKITKLLGLSDDYEIVEKMEDWNRPLFRYLIKCRLTSVRTGTLVSAGLGECNSMESKYRWRDAQRKCPNCGKEAIIKGQAKYGGGWLCWAKKGGCGAKWPDGAPEIEGQVVGKVENDDIYSLVNTILKMAEKRSLVDAALHAGRLSNVFTQDIEDMTQGTAENAQDTAKATTASPTPTTQAQDAGKPQQQQPPESPEVIQDRQMVVDSFQALRAKKWKTERIYGEIWKILGSDEIKDYKNIPADKVKAVASHLAELKDIA